MEYNLSKFRINLVPEEALDYIFKTTIITEEDFPNKFKIKK